MKYSQVRERIGDKELRGNDFFSRITHWLHNPKEEEYELFSEDAIEYFEKQGFTSIVAEPSPGQYALNLEWDVPFPSPDNPQFKFIDLFAGIGGFRLGMQSHGGKCVFSSEIDHFARLTYEKNFGEIPFGDITQIPEDKIPDHDVLCGGFPCQPFSIAGVSKKNSLGKKHGFLDETKGTLFFDIARILKAKKPKAFILENVKNLVSHDKGKTFKVIKEALEELGYHLFYKVLDGKYYVPQHRERIFIVGFSKEIFPKAPEFEFPEAPEENPTIEEILLPKPNEKYTLSDKLWDYLQAYAEKHRKKGNGFGFGLVKMDGIARTISARYYKDGSEILVPQEGKNPRKLTPRECARLQGYPDNFEIPVSDTQSYKQFGNSVVMPLVREIGERVAGVISQSK